MQIWQTVVQALTRQQLEAPHFFAPYVLKLQRMLMMALPLFAGVAAIVFAFSVLRMVQLRASRAAVLQGGMVVLVCGLLCVWVFAPLRLPGVSAVPLQQLEIRTRVPGKAEKVLSLNHEQTQALVTLMQEMRCRRGWQEELPYAEYGQTFRIFWKTADGQHRLFLAPSEGCYYTNAQQGLIYPINRYAHIYKALLKLTEDAQIQNSAVR